MTFTLVPDYINVIIWTTTMHTLYTCQCQRFRYSLSNPHHQVRQWEVSPKILIFLQQYS